MSAAYEGPPPPWPVGRDNAKREGWEAFFSGRARTDCPFPPARRDLAVDYVKGWDAARRHDAENPPKRGDIRVMGANRVRFIERELEGDKWEVIGPAHAPLSPNDIGRYDDILGREVRREDLPLAPAPQGWVVDARAVAKILNPALFSHDKVEAHRAASPHSVSGARTDAVDAVRAVLNAAALATRDEAPAEAGDFGDALLAFLFRHGLKVALDVSEIEALRQTALRAQPPAIDIQRIATAAAEGVAKNAGIAPQLAFAPILWALEDALSGSKLKPAAEGRDVLGSGGPLAATADVQVSDVVIRRMVEAHDAEEAAQKGEPSPWREDLGAVDDPAWVSERMTAMRCAVEAGRFTPAEAPSVWMFRVDGKWELSVIEPRALINLAPEDVVQVPISAQPTATFVAKAKHLLDLAEEAEVKALEGDEGCVWPVEALRAAYAALPFVMTITLGGDHAED